MFTLAYDSSTNQYVGLCSLHPLFSHYADTAEEAMAGIQALVAGLDHDSETTDVDVDPCTTTDLLWPPKPPLPGV